LYPVLITKNTTKQFLFYKIVLIFAGTKKAIIHELY